jgi:ubiquinone/menaquinone biosynthesis C-methylase UbiE
MEDCVCPWWLGYFLINPMRKLIQNPKVILSPYVKEGMTGLDIGSGMGYFSLPMAKLTGNNGKVICVDLQEKMLSRRKKRANKSGVSEIIEVRLCLKDSLGISDLKGKIDFALAFAMIHEVPDAGKLLTELYDSLKKGGVLLISEPLGHVKKKNFDLMVDITKTLGFKIKEYPSIKKSYSILLEK